MRLMEIVEEILGILIAFFFGGNGTRNNLFFKIHSYDCLFVCFFFFSFLGKEMFMKRFVDVLS